MVADASENLAASILRVENFSGNNTGFIGSHINTA
jgi:hypothetical protein